MICYMGDHCKTPDPRLFVCLFFLVIDAKHEPYLHSVAPTYVML